MVCQTIEDGSSEANVPLFLLLNILMKGLICLYACRVLKEIEPARFVVYDFNALKVRLISIVSLPA